MKKNIFFFLSLFTLFFTQFTHFAFAHEVYVLSKNDITRDIVSPSLNPFSDVAQEPYLFSLSGLLGIVLVFVVLFVSTLKKVEKHFDPFLFSLKKYAAVVARVTLGVCLALSAFHGALFGPELPFANFVNGNYITFIKVILYSVGILLTLGIFVRTAALVAILLYVFSILRYGTYMLTYANYLGEMLLSLILGAGPYSLDALLFAKRKKLSRFVYSFTTFAEKYSFLVLRILFGLAVFYASFYAKFLHSNLAIDTVIQYHLTDYFRFDPLFVVLGAFIVEAIIGIFFIIGFEVRFTALVFLTFLALSLSYFGEAVWPHMILIGINIVILLHGYDEFTIENKLFGRKKLEPVL